MSVRLREKAVAEKVILLTDSHVTYLREQKKFPLTKEENVRLDYFLHLRYVKSFPDEHIFVEFPMRVGTTTLRADIVVLSAQEFPPYFAVIECKRPFLSASDWEKALEQAKSYEKQLNAQFIAVTDGSKHFCFEVVYHAKQKKYKEIHALPAAKTSFLFWWQIKKRWFRYKKMLTKNA